MEDIFMKIHRLFLPAFVGMLLAPITITGAECENANIITLNLL